jgi:hypothetical protein
VLCGPMICAEDAVLPGGSGLTVQGSLDNTRNEAHDSFFKQEKHQNDGVFLLIRSYLPI